MYKGPGVKRRETMTMRSSVHSYHRGNGKPRYTIHLFSQSSIPLSQLSSTSTSHSLTTLLHLPPIPYGYEFWRDARARIVVRTWRNWIWRDGERSGMVRSWMERDGEVSNGIYPLYSRSKSNMRLNMHEWIIEKPVFLCERVETRNR